MHSKISRSVAILIALGLGGFGVGCDLFSGDGDSGSESAGEAAEVEVHESFPDGLDPAFLPAQFTQSVEELKQRCPDFFGADTAAHCEEYPCAMTFRLEENVDRGDFTGHCRDLAEYFVMANYESHRFELAGGFYFYQAYLGGPEMDAHIAEASGALRSRVQERSEAWRAELTREEFEAPCEEDGVGEACYQMALLAGDDVELRLSLLEQACEGGHGSACYQYAGHRCNTEGLCDDVALSFAERAVALSPDEGRHFSTMGNILCRMERVDEANSAITEACDRGYGMACGGSCSR